MDITATGMALISEPTTPPGGVSATTGAVGSGGGASLCTGLGFVAGGLGFAAGGTQSGVAAAEGAGCESAGCAGGGAVSVLSSIAGAGFEATGGSNVVLGLGPGLLFMVPHADNKTAAATHAGRPTARI
jgi:hypothetical protein